MTRSPRRLLPAVALLPLLLPAFACSSAAPGDIGSSNAAEGSDTCNEHGAGTIQGVDVSDDQGSVDWKRVAASGRKFGIAKATQGTFYHADTFKDNWSGMKDAGLVRGAYHFLDASGSTEASEGTAQANYFLDHIGGGEKNPLGDKDFVMLDWEAGPTDHAAIDQARAFIDQVKARTGHKTLLYSYHAFWEELGDPSEFKDDPFDFSWPKASNGCPELPSPFHAWAMWQYGIGGKGSVPGISTDIDLDVFNGTADEMVNLLGAPVPAAPTYATTQVIVDPKGDLEAFARDKNGDLAVTTQGTSGEWSKIDGLGETLIHNPSVIINLDKEIEVFGVHSNHDLMHRWKTDDGAKWSDWSTLDHDIYGAPATIIRPKAGIEVFAADKSGELVYNRQSDESKWLGLEKLGGSVRGTPAVVLSRTGEPEVFVLDDAGSVEHRAQKSDGGWDAWEHLGGDCASAPSVAEGKGGLEVFCRCKDDHLDRITQDKKTGKWSSWTDMGGTIITDAAAAVNKDGRLEVFALGTSHAMFHIWQKEAGGWSDWSSLGGYFTSEPTALVSDKGELYAFGRGKFGGLDVNHQKSAGGDWAKSFTSLGGDLEEE